MVSDAERMARAGEYVLGRMNDRERERAERDLETDARFRAAVVAVAERMRYFSSGRGDPARAAAAEAMWAGLAARLAALPHMQGANLAEALARPSPLVVAGQTEPRRSLEAAATSFSWRKAARAALRFLRGGFRRASAPRAAAVLESPLVGPCAIVEVHGEGRLRLLLLGGWALGPNEQLSLWGVREDGAAERIGGFGQSAQVWLSASPDARHASFQLGREGVSFVPAGRMSGQPLAEGRVKTLAGMPGMTAAGGAPDPLSAQAR